jgi:hypothetical protein
MDEDVKKHAVRFIEATGRWADAEIFSEEDAWAFLSDLLNEYARPNVKLSDGQIVAMRNLGAAMGMKPGTPLSTYANAVVRNFGEGNMAPEDKALLLRWLHMQVNGGGDFQPARRPPVVLDNAPPGEHWGKPKKR